MKNTLLVFLSILLTCSLFTITCSLIASPVPLTQTPAGDSPGFGGATPVPLITLRTDGTTNTWTQADLTAALQLINRMYEREIKSGNPGRVKWHGPRTRQIVETDETAIIRIDIYADGFAYTNSAAKPVKSVLTNLPPKGSVPAKVRRLIADRQMRKSQ